MVKRITWTLRAHRDRKEILLYWKERNQSSAYSKKLNTLFKKAIDLVAAHPNIGRRTDIDNVRVKIARDYLVFYETGDDEIFILAI
ncbi:MAG: type II toxin-antitoxin system RelE/ParE family toxin [Chitinophagaceae bacterium]|nr:type II toxin-antitoxin system RelE/ParE family toxin [Chitinophagaceae bacterium]